ncbi:MAG: hypothetical protein QOJ34_1952 [Pseudonocardiales bacterium]|jgi:hypothetical protein|nr:hypothetical protein [Pseudonocardiales bacterium]
MDVLLVGSGHPAIRATHHKTLEISPDADITERATCVIAVRGSGARTPVAGDLRITVRAAGESFTFTARGNSSWRPGGPAVIRRSPVRPAGTFATHATAAAGDLPRSIVAAMQRPDTAVSVEVEPLPGRRCAVLFAVDADRPDDARLLAELAAADSVVAEDDAAARLAGLPVSGASVSISGRTLVLTAAGLPGRSVVDALGSVDVETVGLSPALAAAAAFPARGSIVLAEAGADPVAALRDAPAAARLVVEVRADEVMGVLRRAAEIRGAERAVLVQGSAAPVLVATDVPVDVWGAEPVQLCFGPGAGDGELDPRVQAAVGALLDEGVPTRAAARALAELTGWSRRTAYDYVLNRPGLMEQP